MADHRAEAALAEELKTTLSDIDRAKEVVLNMRFDGLSSTIREWWDLLRPEEPSFFNALAQRPGTRRTIDFKAGLAGAEDGANPVIRDVVAVFSQSQLHCLGLAVFLARAVHERLGFIILDDPFLTSDDEHRAHFIYRAVERLHKRGIQVIILTQCRKTWSDLEIEKTFEALLRLSQELDEESRRSVREGLDEESLALFDLLKKPELPPEQIKRLKDVASELLAAVKRRIEEIERWQDREATRDAVRLVIHNHLWSDETGLPVGVFSEDDVEAKTEEVYRHVYRVYPTLPSPFYETDEAA